MEIKWGAGGGRPLRRLARGVRREGGVYRETPLPPEWQLALPGREGSAFAWEAGGRRAVGACVRCRECGTVSLVQFFERGDAEGGRRALRVLSSLADHRRGHRTRWRLFDISADLPRDFRLAASRFQPGRFELCFSRTRRALTLWRWAPAAALLQGRTLSEFAGTAAGAAGLRFEPATVNGFAGVAATPGPGRNHGPARRPDRPLPPVRRAGLAPAGLQPDPRGAAPGARTGARCGTRRNLQGLWGG